jgi:transcriptional regulator CtsR
VTINLVITNIHQRIELQDMEEGIAKVSVLFDDKSGGSINGFLRVNALLSDQNLQLKKENIDLIGHFVQVSSDYKAAKMDVLQLLTENKVLTDNNTTLIQACKVPAVEQK